MRAEPPPQETELGPRLPGRLGWVLWPLILAGLGFLLARLLGQSWEMPALTWTPAAAASLAGAVLLRLAALGAFAAAWTVLLAACGAPLPPRAVLGAMLLSQLGKYLPGNVFQYAGRLELARAAGAARGAVALSLGLEVALSLLVAGLLLAAGSLWGGPGLEILPLPAWALAAPLLVAALLWVLRDRLPWRRVRIAPGAGLAVLGAYAVFYICDAVGLWLVAAGLFGRSDLAFAPLVAAWAGAWAAGFLSIGAPAGVGVRDLFLVAFLADGVGPGTALGIAVAHRLAVTLGDGAAFPLGLWLRRR